MARKLDSIECVLGIRVCSTYRIISVYAMGVIAEISPVELEIEEMRERDFGTPKATTRKALLYRWQEKWSDSNNGQ